MGQRVSLNLSKNKFLSCHVMFIELTGRDRAAYLRLGGLKKNGEGILARAAGASVLGGPGACSLGTFLN